VFAELVVGVKVLEARFHFQSSALDKPIVVGRVIWNSGASDETPSVEASGCMSDQEWPATILAKLQYLVSTTAPDSFERLLTLRSRFWSFVDISPSRLRSLR
jgi:hypothetical protein